MSYWLLFHKALSVNLAHELRHTFRDKVLFHIYIHKPGSCLSSLHVFCLTFILNKVLNKNYHTRPFNIFIQLLSTGNNFQGVYLIRFPYPYPSLTFFFSLRTSMISVEGVTSTSFFTMELQVNHPFYCAKYHLSHNTNKKEYVSGYNTNASKSHI